MKPLTIIYIIIAAIGLGGTGYFFTQARSIKTELALLKSTDLAKENDVLNLKLKLMEDTLALEKRNHENTKNQLTTSEDRVKTSETIAKKAKSYIDVSVAFNDWQRPTGLHILDRDTSRIDSVIPILGDNDVSKLWQEVKANFLVAKQTGDFRDNDVPVLINSKLVKLLK